MGVFGRRLCGEVAVCLRDLLLLLYSPAISLGFSSLSEIFVCVMVVYSNHRSIHIPSSWMVPAWCVFVSSIHLSRT